MLEIPPGITQARVVAQGGLCASILEIVRDTISITIHNLIKEMYDWSGWHVGTGSRMLSCTAEARVEGRRHSHHPLHHQQGDGRVRAVLGRFTLPSTTFHRHPHCTCVTQHAPNTGTSTYARKSWGGQTRCDLAPQSTSFGTVALRERQHLAMTATCPEGEAWAASRNWNHGTHFLWDPRAAPTFHPLTTQRHRVQRSMLWYNCYSGYALLVANYVEEVYAVTAHSGSGYWPWFRRPYEVYSSRFPGTTQSTT